MTAKDVLAQLKVLGTEQTKKTHMRHGAKEPFFGVKVADLKVLQKKIKTDHALALDLYATGNSDAMYLAGMIADPAAFTKADLQKWVKGGVLVHTQRVCGAVGRVRVAVRPRTRARVDGQRRRTGRERRLVYLRQPRRDQAGRGPRPRGGREAVRPGEGGDRQRPEPRAVRDE